MPLTHTRDLFAKALKGKYALGAFNVNNMELLQAIIEACEEEKAPVMLQISKGARDYAHPVYLKGLIDSAVKLSTIPIAVHLDHGDSFELCKQCIDEGFTSVMIDASHDPFDKNVEICAKVVEYAHKHNCVVEGELGMLVGAQHDDGEEGGSYSKGGAYTHPDEAVQFVKQSGVDSLAVAIGNSHGAYKFKGEQHLDLERLKAIKKALLEAGMGDYPLVLHGASSQGSRPEDQQVRRRPRRRDGRRFRGRYRGGPSRGLHQGQHRHRLAFGHDRRDPRGLGDQAQGVRSPQVSRAGPQGGEGARAPQVAQRPLLRRTRF
jgi:fructose-bisphosphate aldolase class II